MKNSIFIIIVNSFLLTSCVQVSNNTGGEETNKNSVQHDNTLSDKEKVVNNIADYVFIQKVAANSFDIINKTGFTLDEVIVRYHWNEHEYYNPIEKTETKTFYYVKNGRTKGVAVPILNLPEDAIEIIKIRCSPLGLN